MDTIEDIKKEESQLRLLADVTAGRIAAAAQPLLLQFEEVVEHRAKNYGLNADEKKDIRKGIETFTSHVLEVIEHEIKEKFDFFLQEDFGDATAGLRKDVEEREENEDIEGDPAREQLEIIRHTSCHGGRNV